MPHQQQDFIAKIDILVRYTRYKRNITMIAITTI